MTDNEKKRDEDLKRAAVEFFAAKVSQGYTPEQATLMLHERFHQVRKAAGNFGSLGRPKSATRSVISAGSIRGLRLKTA
jgi:hypothetical protein